MCNSRAWEKTVQLLDRVLSVARRPGCRPATGAGSRMRLLSAAGQRIALPGSTDGYDVRVRLGWWRQAYPATYREILAALAAPVRLSVSHGGSRYQPVSLPLLAGHERPHRDPLAQSAQQPGGWIVALAGLAPQGGKSQSWCMRELSRGVPLRSGWLCQPAQPPFAAFLAPLKHMEGPLRAVLSDQQTGLVPAVATVLPHRRPQFCQAQYLRNLAEPLAEAEAACKVALRKTGREQVGGWIRQEPCTVSSHTGVWTVTGL